MCVCVCVCVCVWFYFTKPSLHLCNKREKIFLFILCLLVSHIP